MKDTVTLLSSLGSLGTFNTWSTLSRRNLKTQQTLFVLNFGLRITRSRKSRGSLVAIVFENVRFKMFSFHTKTQTRRFPIPPF